MCINRQMIALAITALAISSGPAQAVDCVSFATLQNPTTEELGRLNVKLTFVDARMNTVNSLVFRKTGTAVNIEPSVACRKSGIDYTADIDSLSTFSVSAGEMQKALDSLATIPAVTSGATDTAACVSVVILDSNGQSSKAFDSVVNEVSARAVLGKLQQALAVNDSAVKAISSAACRFGIASTPPGTDVTSQILLTFSGARFRRNDELYAVTVKIKNTSGTSLQGPAVLAIRFDGSVTPTAPTGFTSCNADPPASAYYRVLSGGGSLAPNATTSLVIRVANPGRQQIRPYRFRVLAGI